MSNAAASMNQFLIGVEKKAFGMAKLAVKNTDDALDIVQNSMMTLAKKYANKPEAEWPPLFFRILQNNIRDFYRSSSRYNKRFSLFSSLTGKDNEDLDIANLQPARQADEPQHRAEIDGATDRLDQALTELPERQRQAFLLRCWEGLSVKQTATSMNCSEGSVKTHYSRAVHKLREELEEEWL